jgi:23S rRNA (uridine2552-2'-O)-methyltransferase
MPKRDQKWLDEHFKDPYVQKAQKEGYLSRAAYKLIELDTREKLLKPSMVVVDLGAAPGGWSQVASQRVGKKGRVFALDCLKMHPVMGVEFIHGDFTEDGPYEALLSMIGDQAVDLVLSDMAPNLSGNKGVDQPRCMGLVELAWDFAQKVLKPNGDFLFKIFHGEGLDAFVKELRGHFKVVKWRKPPASRARSSEIYVLARGYIGYNKS